MINAQKNLYKDYEELLIKNDKLSEENRKLKYNERLLQNKIKTLENKEEESKIKLEEKDSIIKEKDYEIARLKALLNMDGTNHGIPTSQTPINKKKINCHNILEGYKFLIELATFLFSGDDISKQIYDCLTEIKIKEEN